MLLFLDFLVQVLDVLEQPNPVWMIAILYFD